MGWVSIASRWPVRLHGVTASGRDVFALALTGAFKGVSGKVGLSPLARRQCPPWPQEAPRSSEDSWTAEDTTPFTWGLGLQRFRVKVFG